MSTGTSKFICTLQFLPDKYVKEISLENQNLQASQTDQWMMNIVQKVTVSQLSTSYSQSGIFTPIRIWKHPIFAKENHECFIHSKTLILKVVSQRKLVELYMKILTFIQ